MPTTEVFFRRDKSGVPVIGWLQSLRREHRWAFAQCVAAMRRLAAPGYELRRPRAAALRGGAGAVRIIGRMMEGDAELVELAAEAGASAHIVQIVHGARTPAGLTQAELARRVEVRFAPAAARPLPRRRRSA